MALQYYALVNNHNVILDPVKPYTPPKPKAPEFLLEDAKDITLAQYDPVTAGHVVAHRVADYRRRKFTLMMLPDVHLPIDDILGEAGEFNGFV